MQLQWVYTACLVLCLGFGTSRAQHIIRFSDPEQAVSISEQAYFLDDRLSQYTFENIRSDSTHTFFKQATSPRPNFGHTKGTVWCRITINNETDRACFLQIPRLLISQIKIFKPDKEGNYRSEVFGSRYPMNTREIQSSIFYYRLVEPKSGPQTIYIAFKSDHALDVPLSLGTMESCLKLERNEKGKVILMGILLAMFIYNLFISFMIKERSYLYYVLYLLFVIGSLDMIFTGFGFQYFWPETPKINLYLSAVIALSFIFLGLFTTSFLKTNEAAPTLHKLMIGLHISAGIVAVVNVLGDLHIADKLTHLIASVYSIYLIVIATVALMKGRQMAYYFLLAYTASLVCVVLNILHLEQILPFGSVPYHTIFIGYTIEALLLGFAMAHKMRLMRKEKEQAQLEKLNLMLAQNEILERKVYERTEEISRQNEEIQAQNEELITQQEQISAQNADLEIKNHTLKKIQSVLHIENDELKRYSGSLEELISRKTEDLVQANNELVLQNRQLEQFAFIIAHNLRAPVARVLGLMNLLGYLKTSDADYEMVIRKITESMENLDDVIRDLVRILEVRKGSTTNFQLVFVQEKVDRILNILKPELLRLNAEVETDFSNAPFVFSQPEYIESILFHLVTNSLKYRSPERELFISIKTVRDHEGIKLIVRDNGLGIDMGRYGDKLFVLYQRFHHHVQGKGLGLHIVKLQTEALGGKIHADSDGENGTTFIVTVPHNDSE
jgi:two-component system, sensor histidine kinase LadS